MSTHSPHYPYSCCLCRPLPWLLEPYLASGPSSFEQERLRVSGTITSNLFPLNTTEIHVTFCTHTIIRIQSHEYSHRNAITTDQYNPTNTVTRIQSYEYSHTNTVTRIQSRPTNTIIQIQSHKYSHTYTITTDQYNHTNTVTNN